MRSIEETINALKNGEYDDKLTYLYSCDKNDVKKYSDRYIDVINGFEETFGKDGDIAMCYADPEKAWKVLGWKAERGLDEMCADSWRWQSANPKGYEA